LGAIVADPAAGLASLGAMADAPAGRGEAAALVQGLLIQPQFLADAGVRGSLARTLGQPAVAALDIAAARIRQAAASDPSLQKRLAEAAARPAVPAAAVSARLEELRKDFEALGSRSPEALELSADAATSPKVLVALAPATAAPKTSPARPLPPASRAKARSSAPPAPAYAAVWERAKSRTRAWVAAAALGFAAWTGAPHAALAQEPPSAAAVRLDTSKRASYVAAQDINGAPSSGSPDTHAYVIGDVGLDAGTLKSLEAALKGTHWTVVLAETGRGEYYKDAEKKEHRGVDAIDFGTGQALPKKAAFAAQTQPYTGEADGTIFTLVLDSHDLSYHSSAAQNLRSLGQPDFTSGANLISIAIGQMHNGGNITGAVLDTVNKVNGDLATKIASEVRQARADVASAETALSALESSEKAFNQAHPEMAAGLGRHDISGMRSELQAARQALDNKHSLEASRLAQSVRSQATSGGTGMASYETSYASSRVGVESAESAVADLSAKLDAFHHNYPKATGNLARPDIAGMQADVKAARAALSSGDTAKAADLSSRVVTQAAAGAKLLADYPAGKSGLDAVEAKLADLSGRQRSSSAASELAKGKEDVSEARRLYDLGDAAYSARLDSARSAADAAQSAIASADSAAHAFWMGLFTLLSLLTLGTFAAGWFLNRRIRRADGPKATSEKLVSDLDGFLNDKNNKTMMDELDLRVRIHATKTNAKGDLLEGPTKELAEKVREADVYLSLIWLVLTNRVGQARELVFPKGFWAKLSNKFFPGRYNKAKRILSDEKIELNADDGLDDLTKGKPDPANDWKKDALQDFKTYHQGKENQKKSYDELMKMFQENMATAVNGVDKLEKDREAVTPTFEAIGRSIGVASSKKGALEAKASADGLFKVSPIFDVLLPSATKALEDARKRAEKDPIGALDKQSGEGPEAARKAEEAMKLVEAVLAARQGPLAVIAEDLAALKTSGVSTAWLEAELKTLSGDADETARLAVAGSIKDHIADWTKTASALAARAGRAADLDKSRTGTTLPEIKKLEDEVAAARTEIGTALELPAEKVLREEGEDPSTALAEARKQAAEAKAALDLGKLDDASKALTAAHAKNEEAKSILEETQSAFASQDKTLAERRKETKAVLDSIPAAQKVLNAIDEKYAKEVQDLGQGDETHPNGNGTISDNVDETHAALKSAKEKTDASVDAFKAGKILAAAELLRQAKAHQEFAKNRLAEIHDKQARLDKVEAANAKDLAALKGRVKAYATSIRGDRRVMTGTLRALDEAEGVVERAGSLVGVEKGNPFAAQQELAAAKKALDRIHEDEHGMGLAQNDIDLYNHADRTLKAATSALEAARVEARRTQNDQIGDSPAIKAAYGRIEATAGNVNSAERALTADHGDWVALDHEADRLTAEAASVAATLRGEMAAGANAQQSISKANKDVQRATGWSGDYGVTIYGSPGSETLGEARRHLDAGNYAEAQRAAERASEMALGEIRNAEAEVARRHAAYLAEQARIAEERRRREEEERRRREEAEERARAEERRREAERRAEENRREA
jgi:hypothetical protein